MFIQVVADLDDYVSGFASATDRISLEERVRHHRAASVCWHAVASPLADVSVARRVVPLDSIHPYSPCISGEAQTNQSKANNLQWSFPDWSFLIVLCRVFDTDRFRLHRGLH